VIVQVPSHPPVAKAISATAKSRESSRKLRRPALTGPVTPRTRPMCLPDPTITRPLRSTSAQIDSRCRSGRSIPSASLIASYRLSKALQTSAFRRNPPPDRARGHHPASAETEPNIQAEPVRPRFNRQRGHHLPDWARPNQRQSATRARQATSAPNASFSYRNRHYPARHGSAAPQPPAGWQRKIAIARLRLGPCCNARYSSKRSIN